MPSELKRVLVVEDSAVMAHVVRFNLEQVGLEVATARNGVEALQLLEQQEFDLVLTDYQMPEMDGRELCLRLRKHPRLSQIPVVLLTAKGLELESSHTSSEDLNVRAVLSKPFSPAELTRTVLDCLSGAVAQS